MTTGLRQERAARLAARLPVTRRPYDAAKTRDAILNAARQCFGDRGFDHAGLREIAAMAGVDPALVIRYFGSKEKLFLAAIDSDFDLMEHWDEDPANVAWRLAERLCTPRSRHDSYDPFILVLRSASNAKAAELLRQKLEDDVIKRVAHRLDAKDARLRASMLAAVLIGIAFAKDVVGLDGILGAPRPEQIARYAAIIQSCLYGNTDGGKNETHG